MGFALFNHHFVKGYRSSIFALLILLLQGSLSLAQDGTDSIRLPPLTDDAEKLALLLKIKEKIPNLLNDAAQYDIDFFDLLEDEKKLLNHLKSNPKYLELFQNKKYHEIQITPPQEGLEVGEVSIEPQAIQEWKEQLKKKLNQFKEQKGTAHESTHPIDLLSQEITLKVQNITEAQASTIHGNRLLKELGTIKANQKILNEATAKNKAKTLSQRLTTYLGAYDDLPEKPPHPFKENLRQALEFEQRLEQNRNDLRDLIELHSALNRRGQNGNPSHHTWQEAEVSLDELNTDDLRSFNDKENYLRPMINHLIPSSSPELLEDMLKGIHKNISTFAKREMSVEKKAINPITISQQHPIVGIFRGCTGGDCSSQYSFPYPNDPNEKVFFILDNEKKVKGYVSATQVMSNGKPSLYVITVSGNRVTSADTELILRGLEKEKATLGVEQILLPAPNMLRRLINFPAPRSVYDRYTDHQPRVSIQYNHPEIRNEIQDYESARDYNEGEYDHMDLNKEAVVLSFKSHLGIDKITTQTQELPTDSLQAPPLDSISMSEVFEFLIDLKRSGRRELEKKVLNINSVRQSLNPEKYHQLTHLISEGQFKPSITVQQFKALLTHRLNALDSSLSHYLDKNPNVIYPGILSCSDAFSTKNIDETAKYMIKQLKKTNGRSYTNESKWSPIIESHLPELNHTKRFEQLREQMLTQLQDHDALLRVTALNYLGTLKPSEPNIHLKISHSLQDSDPKVRQSALNALKVINPSHPKIHLKIADSLEDPDSFVRSAALSALQAIKPSDTDIHLKISHSLQDSDSFVTSTALSTLKAIKPTHPFVHASILETAFLSSNERYRDHLLSALSAFGIDHHEIYSGILGLAFHYPNPIIRRRAISYLGKITLSHPEVSKNLLRLAIRHHRAEERALAIHVLQQLNLSDPSIRQALQLEVKENLQDLRNRNDLFNLLSKIVYPYPILEAGNTHHCQSVNQILSSERSLESLIQFFSDHSRALDIPESDHLRIDEITHLPPTPPAKTKTPVNPPPIPW